MMLRRVADLLDAALPWRDAGVERTAGLHRFCPAAPNSEPQRDFVHSDDFIRAMLGGTGGGKTFGLLLAALRFANTPGYKALIIRRTHPALASPDGPVWAADELLAGIAGATWRATDKRWLFRQPSGPPAVLQFASCDHDDAVQKLMGPSWDFIGIDELPEFSTSKVWSTLITRFRRKADSAVPPRLRATGNPGGPGQRWVVDEIVRKGLHVHSTFRDNPAIDRDDYAEKLALLPETMRAWFEAGDFNARPTGLVYPLHLAEPFAGVTFLPNAREDGWRFVLGHDPGTSVIAPTMAFSAIAWNAHEAHKVYVLRSTKLFGGGSVESAIERGAKLLRSWLEDFPNADVVVDPGAFGEDFVTAYRERYDLWCEMVPKSPGYKRTAQLVFRGMLERGGEVFVDRAACKPLVDECEELVWSESGLNEDPSFENHCADATLYAVLRTPAYLESKRRPEVRTAADQARYEASERKRELAEGREDEGGWVRR
jgi:hypothetical protein